MGAKEGKTSLKGRAAGFNHRRHGCVDGALQSMPPRHPSNTFLFSWHRRSIDRGCHCESHWVPQPHGDHRRYQHPVRAPVLVPQEPSGPGGKDGESSSCLWLQIRPHNSVYLCVPRQADRRRFVCLVVWDRAKNPLTYISVAPSRVTKLSLGDDTFLQLTASFLFQQRDQSYIN